MDAILRQIRYGIRSLWKDKGFAITVVLTLAVCLGGNTAIFTIVSSILLRPLPVPEAGSILLMSNQYPKAGVGESSQSGVGDYFDRRQQVTALQEQALFNFANQTIDLNGSPERLKSMSVTPSLFRLLRTYPLYGRAFTDQEGEVGQESKVILSHSLWRQRYGSDPNVIGRELRLSGRPFVIVGIMPAGFLFIDPDVRMWVPLTFTAEEKQAHHNNSWYHLGRLKPGATLEQVKAQVDAVNAANLDRFPQFKDILINAGFYTRVERLQDHLVRNAKAGLFLLWGGALFVLLIGVVNLANISLARANLRIKDLATRLALGAGRARIVTQLVVEHLLVSLAGGLAGLALGAAILRMLANSGLDQLPRANEVRIDTWVVLAGLAVSTLVGVVIGLAPLTQIFRITLSRSLRENSRTGTSGRRARTLRQGLVVFQIGCAFMLLVGAGLLLVSFRELLHVDPGFRTEGVFTASTYAPGVRYGPERKQRDLMTRSLGALSQMPGVTAAGATSTIPFSGDYNDSVILAEGALPKAGESVISPRRVVVTPGYFEAMRVPLTRGRYFEERDNETASPVIIVDERLARRFWPGSDPIGKRMYQPESANDIFKTNDKTQWLKVVGVVASVRLEDLAGTGSPVGAYYFPYAQRPSRSFTFAIKANGESSALGQRVRSAIAAVDPELALYDMRTMVERTELSLSSRRTSMLLALGFGLVALLLSALGIYGVLAYLVTQRRREIGIRIALGSTSVGILRLVLKEGLALAAVGIASGVVGARAIRQVLESQVYGVGPTDPLVIGAVMAILGTVALAACLLPARKAMQVDAALMLNME